MAQRMMLYDRLFRHAVQHEDSFFTWEKDFRDVPVYDVSSIYELGCSGVDIPNSGIPMRLPGPRVWMEWSDTTDVPGRGVLQSQIGFIAREFNAEREALLNSLHTHGHIDFYKSDHYYLLNGFVFQYASPSAGVPQDMLMMMPAVWIWALSSDFMDQKMRWVMKMPSIEAARELSSYYLSTGTFDPSLWKSNPGDDPWPLFGATALLHCRNIVTEEVRQDKKHPHVKGEREHRPYCSYKVLKLEVPRRMAERQGDDVEGGGGDGEPKVRFHLCRGHFKNLQHPRYKQKGWHWWPAHWKGSIELGRADKSYQLQAAAGAQ